MTEPVPLRRTVDNTDGFRMVRPPTGFRPRTIKLWFSEHKYGYQLTADGNVFADYGPGPYRAIVPHGRDKVNSAVEDLRGTWQRCVIEARHPAKPGAGSYTWPYEGVPAADDAAAAELWQRTGRELAEAGHQLFRLLFGEGGDDRSEIAERLYAALRGGEQIITVNSDVLFAPWSMLYTPRDPDAPLHREDAAWEPDGFWGYRHLVEHCVARFPGYRTEIPVAGQRPVISMNVDRRAGARHGVEFFTPTYALLRQHAEVILRTHRSELAEAILRTGLAEHVMYFGCHGTAGQGGPRLSSPALYLEDRRPIHAGDLVSWFRRRPAAGGPVVYLAACKAGQIATPFHTSFGRVFLEAGANCLVGPQIDLPVPFATEYTGRFFERFCQPGTRIGDITRDLAREFIDRHHTPLGLIFTLHRGLDTHLGPGPDTASGGRR